MLITVRFDIWDLNTLLLQTKHDYGLVYRMLPRDKNMMGAMVNLRHEIHKIIRLDMSNVHRGI